MLRRLWARVTAFSLALLLVGAPVPVRAEFTDALENALLDHVFRNTAYTPAATVYAALFTVACNDAGGGTEVSGGNYARQAITFGTAANGTISNSQAITWATVSWTGTPTHVAIFDAATDGTMLWCAAITSPQAPNAGQDYSIPIGGLVVSLD